MLSAMWGDLTGTPQEDLATSETEKKPSAKSGAKTARRGKRD